MGPLRVLYLTYDGLLEPLGQSQVLPYLRGLAVKGAGMTVLTFEKPVDLADRQRAHRLEAELASRHIRWVPLRYHKRPQGLAKLYDLVVGVVTSWWIIRREQIQIIHARSYLPALMAWVLKRLVATKWIFDMRGFWADERLDAGQWHARSPGYRLVKWLEPRFFQDAEAIVTLTERARQMVEHWPGVRARRVTVIPTCVDLERFATTAHAPPPSAPVIVYTGSLGTRYLLQEMLRWFAVLRQRHPDARLLLVTRHQEELRLALNGDRALAQAISTVSVDHPEVPRWLAQARAGLAFYKPGWSRQGTCPTKVGEYLAMSLPVVVNEAVGDMKTLVTQHRVGVAISDAFSQGDCERAVEQLEALWTDPALAQRCRTLAETHFALPEGIERYWTIYQQTR